MLTLLNDLRIGNNIRTKFETIIMNIINILITNVRIIVCITKLIMNILLSFEQILMQYIVLYISTILNQSIIICTLSNKNFNILCI